MTDNELKFFDPETGKPLHRVPEGATIPAGTPYGFMRSNGNRGWVDGGAARPFDQLRDVTYFTREPIAPPASPLPTEPGSVVIAHTEDDEERRVFIRVADATLYPWVDCNYHWLTGQLIDPEPARVVPNDIGVMDETDKRDRLDADGDRWEWDDDRDLWHRSACPASRLMFGTLASLKSDAGPLRFADEVIDR